MKKLLKIAVLLSCVAVLLSSVTACSNDDDKVSIYTYVANGSVSGSISALTDYTSAIRSVTGGSYVTSKCDDEIIAACDEVYEYHKTYDANASGSVQILRYEGTSSDSSSEVIKTYTY